jgi:spore germination cell wall hydrolase CwlJ-like protein
MYRNKCQFSWFCDGKGDEPNLSNIIENKAWEDSIDIAKTMMEHCVILGTDVCPKDLTKGALYYHRKDILPYWTASFNVSAEVGDHIFYTLN